MSNLRQMEMYLSSDIISIANYKKVLYNESQLKTPQIRMGVHYGRK